MEHSGVALWRRIKNTLSQEIDQGDIKPDQRLPSSQALAARFGVNRHTVLKAVSALQEEGKVRIERGRGTYAVANRLDYNIGPNQLFEQNLAAHNLAPSRTVLSVAECHAPSRAADALELSKGSQVLQVTTLGEAEGLPVNYGIHYIAGSRLPGIAQLFRSFEGKTCQVFTFPELFGQCGINEYRRKDVVIRSRRPTNDEARYLNIPAVEHVLTTRVVSVGPKEIPLTYAETAFAGSRVSFRVSF